MFLFQLTFTILSPKSSPPLTLITLVFGFGGGDGDGGKTLFGGAVLGTFVVVVVVVVVVKCVVIFLGFFVLVSKAFGYFVEVISSLGGGGVGVKIGGEGVL